MRAIINSSKGYKPITVVLHTYEEAQVINELLHSYNTGEISINNEAGDEVDEDAATDLISDMANVFNETWNNAVADMD